MLISELKENLHFIDLSRNDMNKVFLDEEISLLVSNLFSLQEDRELNEAELNSIKLGLMNLDLIENEKHKNEIIIALDAVLIATKATVSYQREQFAMHFTYSEQKAELLPLVYMRHLTATQYRDVRLIAEHNFELVFNVPQLIRFLNEKPSQEMSRFLRNSFCLKSDISLLYLAGGAGNYDCKNAFLKLMQFLIDNMNIVSSELFVNLVSKLHDLVDPTSENKIFNCFDEQPEPIFMPKHPCILIFSELFKYINETVKSLDLSDLDSINQLNLKEIFSLCIKLKIQLNETNIGKIIEAAIGDQALFLSMLREKGSCDQAQFDDLIEALRQNRFVDVCNNDTQNIYQLPVDIINRLVLPYATSESSRYKSLIISHKAKIAASSSSCCASSSSSSSTSPSHNKENNYNNDSSVVQVLLRNSSSLFSTSSPSQSSVSDTSKPSASSSSALPPFQN